MTIRWFLNAHWSDLNTSWRYRWCPDRSADRQYGAVTISLSLCGVYISVVSDFQEHTQESATCWRGEFEYACNVHLGQLSAVVFPVCSATNHSDYKYKLTFGWSLCQLARVWLVCPCLQPWLTSKTPDSHSCLMSHVLFLHHLYYFRINTIWPINLPQMNFASSQERIFLEECEQRVPPQPKPQSRIKNVPFFNCACCVSSSAQHIFKGFTCLLNTKLLLLPKHCLQVMLVQLI